ncbi:hypothetical protein GQ457_05G015820 [Hibiscus cannabinus]
MEPNRFSTEPNGPEPIPPEPKATRTEMRPPAPEERTEPATPHVDTAASVPKPPAKTATASKRTLTRKDKGKAPVRASPHAPAPEATVELDSDDDNDEDMPDAPPPPAPPMEPITPRRRLKRKANRNISTADLAAEENIAYEAEDDGSSTTPEETPIPNPPSSKVRYKRVLLVVMCRCAVTRIEKEEMLQHSRKDDEHRDTTALDFLGSRNATTYWSAEQTKCRKDKAAKIFCCSHGTPAGIDSPYKKNIKGAGKRGLGRKEREEKVERGDLRERKLAAAFLLPQEPTIVELQARVLLHLGRDNKLDIEPLQAVELADGNCQVFRLWIVRNTLAYSVEHNSWDYTTASMRLKEDRSLLQSALAPFSSAVETAVEAPKGESTLNGFPNGPLHERSFLKANSVSLGCLRSVTVGLPGYNNVGASTVAPLKRSGTRPNRSGHLRRPCRAAQPELDWILTPTGPAQVIQEPKVRGRPLDCSNGIDNEAVFADDAHMDPLNLLQNKKDVPVVDTSMTDMGSLLEAVGGDDRVIESEIGDVWDLLPGQDGSSPKPSFRDKLLGRFRASSGFSTIPDLDVEVRDEDVRIGEGNGMPEIWFSNRVHDAIDAKLEKSMIIRLLDKAIGYRALRNRIMALWSPSGEINLIDLDNGYYLVRFSWRRTSIKFFQMQVVNRRRRTSATKNLPNAKGGLSKSRDGIDSRFSVLDREDENQGLRVLEREKELSHTGHVSDSPVVAESHGVAMDRPRSSQGGKEGAGMGFKKAAAESSSTVLHSKVRQSQVDMVTDIASSGTLVKEPSVLNGDKHTVVRVESTGDGRETHQSKGRVLPATIRGLATVGSKTQLGVKGATKFSTKLHKRDDPGKSRLALGDRLSALESDLDRTAGANDPGFFHCFKLLMKKQVPDIVVMMEPRVSGVRADRFIRKSGFEFSYRYGAIHFFGTFVYASPSAQHRKDLWDQLLALNPRAGVPWVVGGDLNVISSSEERLGGSQRRSGICCRFNDFLFASGLMDMGYSGPKFTWRRGNLSQRLNRCLSNFEWVSTFPSSEIIHLPKIGLDHRPILLDTACRSMGPVVRPFRYLAAWNDHPAFHEFLSSVWGDTSDYCGSVGRFQEQSIWWNKEVFGHIEKRKNKLLARIKGVERALDVSYRQSLVDLEDTLHRELDIVLEQEESLWFQNSRSNWIQQGDRNTKYFHLTTARRQKQNMVRSLRVETGGWCDD